MFIVILGWLYVIAMVAITAPSAWLGVMIFLGGGVAPVALWLYIAGSRIRRSRAMRRSDAGGVALTPSASDAGAASPGASPAAGTSPERDLS